MDFFVAFLKALNYNKNWSNEQGQTEMKRKSVFLRCFFNWKGLVNSKAPFAIKNNGTATAHNCSVIWENIDVPSVDK